MPDEKISIKCGKIKFGISGLSGIDVNISIIIILYTHDTVPRGKVNIP